MYSCVTVPSATEGSHMVATWWRKRLGSRYRYVLVSDVSTPRRLRAAVRRRWLPGARARLRRSVQGVRGSRPRRDGSTGGCPEGLGGRGVSTAVCSVRVIVRRVRAGAPSPPARCQEDRERCPTGSSAPRAARVMVRAAASPGGSRCRCPCDHRTRAGSGVQSISSSSSRSPSKLTGERPRQGVTPELVAGSSRGRLQGRPGSTRPGRCARRGVWGGFRVGQAHGRGPACGRDRLQRRGGRAAPPAFGPEGMSVACMDALTLGLGDGPRLGMLVARNRALHRARAPRG